MPSNTDARHDLSIESAARWAYHLGYFLLADARDARSVLYQAAARLYVTALTQKKRQAKRPKSEIHKKLSLPPRQLLQYLTYLSAEPYEAAQEREHRAGQRTLTVEDMIVRYIKHLMVLYLEHNSFYATVGQSCVLFDLGTSQAERLYEILVQGSAPHLDTKGDYSVRDAKREIRQRLARRFGEFLTACEGARKEQLFVVMDDADAHFKFVKRCLHRLQPVQAAEDRAGGWHLPARFDVTAYDLVELQYDEGKSDLLAEQAAELRRLHALTHPCCWARLLRAFCQHYSRQRMVLPEFNLNGDEHTYHMPPRDREAPPELTRAELEGLTEILKSEARRRKGLFATRLSVSVDGVPYCSWAVYREGVVEVSVGAGARVLTVSAEDSRGEVLLAQYLPQLGGASSLRGDEPASVVLEGGQEFTFTASRAAAASGDDEGLLVTIRFRENRLLRAAAGYASQRYERLGAALASPYAAGLRTAAVVCVLFFVLLLTGLWFLRTTEQTRRAPAVASDETGGRPPQSQPPRPEPTPATTDARRTEGGEKDGRMEDGYRRPGGEQRPAPLSAKTSAGGGRATRRAGGAGHEAVETRPPSQIVLSLQDGAGRVTLDEGGRLAGLEQLSPTLRTAVTSALLARRVDRPAVLASLGGEAEVLLGSSSEAVPVAIVGPVGTMVESDRPLLRWRALEGATSYRVAVFDAKLNPVAGSGTLRATEWSPASPLRRGAAYVWQVTAVRDGKEITSPRAPAPEARFAVMDSRQAHELERARRLHPKSHLALGVLYARAGLAEEAEQEFRALLEANPDSPVARSLLESVREWRRADR